MNLTAITMESIRARSIREIYYIEKRSVPISDIFGLIFAFITNLYISSTETREDSNYPLYFSATLRFSYAMTNNRSKGTTVVFETKSAEYRLSKHVMLCGNKDDITDSCTQAIVDIIVALWGWFRDNTNFCPGQDQIVWPE